MVISTSVPQHAELLGIFGGSFDPVHFGHIKPTLEIISLLGIQQLRLMPCNISPFKDETAASAQHRIAMLELVAANVPEFVVDRRELNRSAPSYSIDSLEQIVNDFPDRIVCWLMGQDAFSSLPIWHRASEFIRLCHVIVAIRGPVDLLHNEKVIRKISARRCYDIESLREHRGGYVHFVKTSPVDVSSTRIREMIKAGHSPKYLLPGNVWNYIKRNRLYGYREITA